MYTAQQPHSEGSPRVVGVDIELEVVVFRLEGKKGFVRCTHGYGQFVACAL